MANARIDAFNQEGEKILTFLHGEYAKLQTGRANAALVESVVVDAYGQRQPLKGVAGISVQDAKTIIIQPWDNSIMQKIESALTTADLGLITLVKTILGPRKTSSSQITPVYMDTLF